MIKQLCGMSGVVQGSWRKGAKIQIITSSTTAIKDEHHTNKSTSYWNYQNQSSRDEC